MLLKNKKTESEKTEKPVKVEKVKDNGFNKMPVLSKLRLIVGLIFVLSTISAVIALAGQWFDGGLLVLISYIMLIALTVKLFLVKKL
ncbi:MAG TPA: hypothetical protein VGB37_09395 [Candidatus Lokiarchaeia archaeon]